MILSDQYNKTIRHLADAIYVCDEAGFITTYNQAAAELWGREPLAGKEQYCGAEKMVAGNGQVILPEQSPVAITLQSSQPAPAAEMIVFRPDGTTRKVVQYTSPIFDAWGKLTGAINRMVDMTGNPAIPA